MSYTQAYTSLPQAASTGIVIYGESGCGKSTYAKALAAHFGKTRIVDNWIPGGKVDDDSIVLTNHPHDGSVDFYSAAKIAGIKLPHPVAPRPISRSPSKCIECQQPLGDPHLAHCALIPFVAGEPA